MPPRRKRKSRTTAPCVVLFTQVKQEGKGKQLCVFAECTYGGTRMGPIWGHSSQSVRKCLAMLTTKCDCGRTFHKHRYSEGFRVHIAGKAAD